MYRLTKFGTLAIEHYNQVDAIGSGATPSAYQTLPEGGALDLFGSQQKHAGNVERVKSMRLSAATEAALEALYFGVLQLRGKRDRLYRRTVSGDIHWQYARLVEVSAQRTYELAKYKLIQDVDLRFVTQEAFWRGDFGGVWTLDAGEYLDTGLAYDSGDVYALSSSPTALTIAIGTDAGRAPTRAVRMTISAGASAMSAITIARTGGESVTFSGTINANKQLVIDTGTMQVLNDGVDAYADLTLSPTADLAAWFSLLRGSNAITVTFTGGGTGKQIAFQYYEAWY
jgi:hypothetical protein